MPLKLIENLAIPADIISVIITTNSNTSKLMIMISITNTSKL